MSAETLTVDRYRSALKTLFPRSRLETYGMKDQPLWAWMPKGGGFGGRNAEIPIRYSPVASNSHTFSRAQAAKGSSRYTHFTVDRRRDYLLISLENEALEASEGHEEAYINARESEIDAAFTKIVQQASADLQGNGGGVIGVVQAVDSGANYFTVQEHEIGRFEPDMRLQFGSTDGLTGAVIATAYGYAKVDKVDHDNLRVYLAATADTIASVAVDATTNKYVFPEGNFGLSMTGLNAWLPSNRTQSFLDDPFKGVDRSVFPSRLAGIYFDGSTYSLAECLERAMARAKRERVVPDVIWLNHNRFADLSLELGAKAEREPAKIGEFAYDRLKMYTGGRQISIMADHNIPDAQAWGLTRESWKFWSLKGAPRFLGRGGDVSNMILEPGADGWEIRVGWYGDLVCYSPGENVNIVLPAA